MEQQLTSQAAGIAPAAPFEAPPRWGINTPAVRKALRFIKRRGGSIQVDELVEWDLKNGKQLFQWNEAKAAHEHRLQQARIFLNAFRRTFDGMRVRGFIHVREDHEAGIEKSAYVSLERIVQHEGMRAQVIADITKRMAMLANELAMWNLSEGEREALLQRLREALS